MTTFFEEFNPFRGDVVYGTTGARTRYLKKYLASGEKQALEHQAQTKFTIGNRGFYINDYNEPLTGSSFSNPETITNEVFKIADNEAFQAKYAEKLFDTRYSPTSVFERATWQALAKGDTRLRTSLKTTPKDQMDKARMILAVRRSCKYGIEYVSNLPSGAKVHYVLDEIDIAEVVTKTERPLWTFTEGVPITTTELRFLFRNWNYFKNKRILFYKNFLVVDAPWVSEPGAWSNYAIQLVEKHKARLRAFSESAVTEFYFRILTTRYDEAVKLYHAFPVPQID